VLWKASTATCSECHDPSEVERYQYYHESLRGSLPEIETSISSVRAALESADLPQDRSDAITAQLDDLRHDVDFLQTANDIHNIHYARALIQAIIERLSALCSELEIEEPNIVLPPKTEQSE
jgi:hypothetical protein